MLREHLPNRRRFLSVHAPVCFSQKQRTAHRETSRQGSAHKSKSEEKKERRRGEKVVVGPSAASSPLPPLQAEGGCARRVPQSPHVPSVELASAHGSESRGVRRIPKGATQGGKRGDLETQDTDGENERTTARPRGAPPYGSLSDDERRQRKHACSRACLQHPPSPISPAPVSRRICASWLSFEESAAKGRCIHLRLPALLRAAARARAGGGRRAAAARVGPCVRGRTHPYNQRGRPEHRVGHPGLPLAAG
jgi:hypothetical protein